MSSFDLNDLLKAEDLVGATPDVLNPTGAGDVMELVGQVCERLHVELEQLRHLPGLSGVEADLALVDRVAEVVRTQEVSHAALNSLLGTLSQAGDAGFAPALRAWLATVRAPL